MPRKAREISISNVYHVIFRGNDKQDIFYDNQDRYIFLDRIKKTKEKYNYEVYAYCLMTNHIHLIIKVEDKFLSKSMQNLSLRYSMYFNKKFNRTGHLFQGRYTSKRIESLNYFINVCKYVHRNPEKANIEKTEKYRWSSFLGYINNNDEIINREALLHHFNDNIDELRKYTLKDDDKEKMLQMPEYEMIKKLSEDEIANIIKTKYNLKNVSDISLLGKKEKDSILKELKESKIIAISQLSRMTRVTRYYIEKKI